jgi:hypothetical protein
MLPVMGDRMRLVHLGECMGLWRAALALGMLWSVPATALAQKAFPPLVEAAAQGSVQGVRDLIAAGADLNQRDENGITALIILAYAGNVEIVRLLLAVKANPNGFRRHDRRFGMKQMGLGSAFYYPRGIRKIRCLWCACRTMLGICPPRGVW